MQRESNMDIRQIDICFVVDTTGSMGSFINEAKRKVKAMLEVLSSTRGVDLQASLVEYRDYPPQDNSYVTSITGMTPDLKKVNEAINMMEAGGGGDEPEAVYEGVQDAAEKIEWRENSVKLIVLVGDAPPHAMNGHDLAGEPPKRLTVVDGWLRGIPADVAKKEGREPSTLHTCTAAVEKVGAVVYAMCVSHSSIALSAFSEICELTGGKAYGAQSNAVMETIKAVLETQIDEIDLQEKVMAAMKELGTEDLDEIAEHIGVDRKTTTKGYYGLRSRGYE